MSKLSKEKKIKNTKKDGKAQKKGNGKRFSIGIRTQLNIVTIIPIIFIIVLGVTSYQKASDEIVESYKVSTQNTILKAGEYYELMFKNLENISQGYAQNTDITKYYNKYYELDSSVETKVFVAFHSEIMQEAKSNEFLSAVHLYGDYGKFVSTYGAADASMYASALDSATGQLVTAGAGEPVWTGAHMFSEGEQQGISLNRTLQNSSGQDVAMFTMDVDYAVITDPIASMSLADGSYSALITQDNYELTTERFAGLNTIYDKPYYQEAIAGEAESGILQIKDQGVPYLFAYAKVGETGSTIVCQIPESVMIAQADSIKWFTVIMVILAVLITVPISAFMATGIGRTIKKINRVTKLASEGDLTGVVSTRRSDELGSLIVNTSAMLNDMKGLIGKAAHISGSVSETADVITEDSSLIVEISKQILEAVDCIESGVNAQATDAQNCKEKMNQLSEVIDTVASQTELIEESSNETMKVLTVGVSTIDELTQNIESTTAITNSAIVDMEALSEESMKITTIINTINEIAEQTNLLSLNASIEAARAGAAGRGFSVVADEIRKLAEECIKASNQIDSIISSVQVNIQETVGTVKDVGLMVTSQEEALKDTISTFNTMKLQIDSMHENVDAIISNVQIMNEMKDDTMEAMENISVVIEETAASSTEVLTSVNGQVETMESFDKEVNQLKEKSATLSEFIGVFKI